MVITIFFIVSRERKEPARPPYLVYCLPSGGPPYSSHAGLSGQAGEHLSGRLTCDGVSPAGRDLA